MPKLPKLKVKMLPEHCSAEVRDFEYAKDLPFSNLLVIVEGQRITSYDELVQLVTQNNYRRKESLEVIVLTPGLIDGG